MMQVCCQACALQCSARSQALRPALCCRPLAQLLAEAAEFGAAEHQGSRRQLRHADRAQQQAQQQQQQQQQQQHAGEGGWGQPAGGAETERANSGDHPEEHGEQQVGVKVG